MPIACIGCGRPFIPRVLTSREALSAIWVQEMNRYCPACIAFADSPEQQAIAAKEIGEWLDEERRKHGAS